MTFQSHLPDRLQRSFRDTSDEVANAVEQPSILFQMGWKSLIGWRELLQSRRVLIVSEAGAGKTHECRAEQAARWAAGEPAFYFELAELSRNNLSDLLDTEEQLRFDAWLISQSDVATVFLDSIDELKLTRGSFEGALKRFSKAVAGQLGRVRIVITTRPIPIDRALIKKHLPIPVQGEAVASEDAFADIAMNRPSKQKKDSDDPPDWRYVALMPLSNDQIREMAAIQGVTDAEALLKDVHKRNAEDFARRPQDLIELCVDWRDHHRIRTHREQVEYNITIKLKPRTDRGEKAQLSGDKAVEGASRLALATLLTRKLTLRHSAEADQDGEAGTALDAAAILTDWTKDERETLLERPLFGFASYGRVRFHHRSVIEYLAAQHLHSLLNCGMSIKAVKRLLFAETLQGIKVVKPSMKPIAAWLAFLQSSIFSEVRDRDPDVLFDHADPESLTPDLRIDALRAYVERYGQGSWRGMHVPGVQVHRFASKELGPEVLRLWHSGIGNPEVRALLLEIAAAASIPDMAGIAYSVVMHKDVEIEEHMDALNVLLKLNDSRLDAVTLSMANDPDVWSNKLLKNFVPQLFPQHIAVDRLCSVLSHITQARRSVDMLNHFWIPSIADSDIAADYLEALREGLTHLVEDGMEWKSEWRHMFSPRHHLVPALAAVCLRQMKEGDASEAVIYSSVLIHRLTRNDFSHVDKEPIDELRQVFEHSAASVREMAFWADDALCQMRDPQEKPMDRLYEASNQGLIRLNHGQDVGWVLANLSDSERPLAQRSMMLEAAMRKTWDGRGEWREHVLRLKIHVADCPDLISTIEEKSMPVPVNHEYARMEAERLKNAEHAKRRQAKDHASWVLFWREVANNPDTAFSPDRSGQTAWNLWQAMHRSGKEGRSSGWNRRFIEQHFSKDTADRLRMALVSIWRKDCPTLRTERTDSEKNTFLIRWQLGLAGIAAEAEDSDWARKLTQEEAKLASRYAPLELNGFPSWLESLVVAHPMAVESVLGAELTNELVERGSSGMLLQDIRHATTPIVALFLPRIHAWFDANHQHLRESTDSQLMADRLHLVIKILLAHGDEKQRAHISTVAQEQLARKVDTRLVQVWLPTLMQLNPAAGVQFLEQNLQDIEPSKMGQGVEWIGLLFGERYHHTPVDLDAPEFTPSLLLTLVRLAYHHVCPSDDAHHEGAYSPDLRDHAERGRGILLNALLSAKGQEGWQAKLEMANDPLFKHFRDRALLIAREKAAAEAEAMAMSESQVVALNRHGESPPMTREDMFALLVDRLDDLDDLLLRDDSPRAAWAAITDEKVMRREITRELRNASNNAYTVDQEGVTADEKETDIRLRAVSSDQQAVIELKLGDKRPGRDLRDTIKNQLVTKYMAPESCRSGCLLVTVNHSHGWKHPDSGKSLDIAGLASMLQAEALKVTAEMGGMVQITARVLDLRPRLAIEKISLTAR
ncbi:hypothetical protein MIZ03_3387 [Rhodoferax lithotrophicus]|uniref:ATP-binding protein n=1 Tax=Rhodoferax lithotrophicus TaxID=2798804 RepID=A0ABN6D8Z9_9BURK|nr:ATP-binding protein [Rhodoferax sp. MIZ03]BCO28481.1 hypothetical protein MIZ03_3387 [Rhodoferax sp. MIZ03]